MRLGIDVSDYQGPIDWAKVAGSKSPEISFAYAKATEGAHEVQDTFAYNHDQARTNGLSFGAYHFFSGEVDPNAQANHFIAYTLDDGRAGNLLPMVDVEIGHITSESLSTFLKVVQQAFKVPAIIIYTDAGYWDGSGLADGFSGHPLWVANFINSDVPKGAPYMPQTGGWSKWTIWQYSDHGVVPGIGNVDMDYCPDLAAITRP